MKTCRSIDALSRDTASAHTALENNFDKDAIRDKLEIQQQATALGTQAVTTYMDSKLDAARKQAREEMAAAGQLDGLSEEEIKKKIEASETFKTADKEYGIGSTFWTTGTAATGLLAGVLGGNVQSGAAAATAPLLAKMIKEATAGKGEAGEVARIALHTLASAVLAKAQGGDSTAGAVGGFIAAAGAKAFALAIYGKDADRLAPDEKMVILNLVAALGAAGGGAVTGNTQGMVSAGNAARVEVENNSLKGDEYRDNVKQSAEWWKQQVRGKLGENIASQLANGLINFASETGDMAMLGGDTAFDLMAALATCATGDGYCSQAKSDLAKKDAAAASMLNAIMNGEAWEGIKSTAIKAANGDQRALENVAGILSGTLVPGKILLSGSSTTKVVVKPNELKGGAGGNWNVLDEIADPNVVKQTTPTGCGGACGEMLLKDRNVFVDQTQIGTGLKSPEQLARDLTQNGGSSWSGGFVGFEAYDALNKTGSWSAMMWDQGSKIGHWVVVKGSDSKGHISIYDPWKGTSYKMTEKDFKETWNGNAVFNQ